MKLLNNDGKRRFLLHVSAAKGGSASECTSAFFHLPYLQTWLYFRHVLVCKTWEFKAFTFSKWSMSRTLKEKTPGFSLPPPLWTWSWTLWGAGPGLRRMDFRSFSPWTRRSQSRSGVNSRATNPCEKSNCHPFFFFFLARYPTRGHHSREIRGCASTPQRGQQLRPTLASLVTVQAPTLLIPSS